jgi:hypothetical protein
LEDIIYQIRIKKEYANDAMMKLQQEEAIEIITNIPEWQKNETLKRLDVYKSNPDDVVSEDEVLSMLNDAGNE